MIVIGTDTHKRSHTCGAVDALTAAARGELTVARATAAFGELLRWARRARPRARLGDRGLPARLRGARAVPDRPRRAGRARRAEATWPAPALVPRARQVRLDRRGRVARAALKEGIDELPSAQLDGIALDIRLLVDHRERLVAHADSD